MLDTINGICLSNYLPKKKMRTLINNFIIYFKRMIHLLKSSQCLSKIVL